MRRNVIVKVVPEWNGLRDGHRFRLVMPDGKADCVRGSDWTRNTASRALDLLAIHYGLKRSLIRFRHK